MAKLRWRERTEIVCTWRRNGRIIDSVEEKNDEINANKLEEKRRRSCSTWTACWILTQCIAEVSAAASSVPLPLSEMPVARIERLWIGTSKVAILAGREDFFLAFQAFS